MIFYSNIASSEKNLKWFFKGLNEIVWLKPLIQLHVGEKNIIILIIELTEMFTVSYFTEIRTFHFFHF